MKIVVVGGGFAGLNLIKNLWAEKGVEIILVDRNNYHFFPPLLYQVSTSFIEASNISHPFRRLFGPQRNVRFHMGTLLQIFPEKKEILTDGGTYAYDMLVLAMGTETNFFGMKAVQEKAWPMKTIDEAQELRNHVLLNLEKASREPDPQARERLLNIVICGGGPTGVELAGMLAELGRHIAPREYPDIPDIQKARIYLVDAGPALLGPMSKTAQEEAYKVLSNLGVQIILNTAVKDYADGVAHLADGSTLETETLVWASGVIAREAPGLPKESIGKGRRILVDAFNKVSGTGDIYAIGDICLQTTDAAWPNGHPQVAQVALQQGTLLAQNIKRSLRSEALKPFVYNDKGSMAIISKYKAVADLPKFSFKGFFAWLVWLFIHIMPLVGFRSKVQLAFSWMWSFVTNNPTLRLILRPLPSQRALADGEKSIQRPDVPVSEPTSKPDVKPVVG